MLRLVNGLLLFSALVGAFVSIRAGLEYQRLRSRHRVLMAEVGLLHVTDPDKAHFVAIDTGEPLHFAWQMYVPERFDTQWKSRCFAGSANHGSVGGSQPYFDLVRVRVRKLANGTATIWMKHRGGANFYGLNAQQLALLEGGPLAVEQLGATGAAVVDRQEVVTLLRWSQSDASGKKPLVDFRFGTPQAFLITRQ